MTNFADLNISAALGNRTVTLANGLIGWAGHNFFSYSEDVTHPNWTKLTIIAASFNRITYAGGTGNPGGKLLQQATPTTVTSNGSFVIAVMLSGTGIFRLKNTHSGVVDNFSGDLVATTTPTMYTFEVNNSSSAGNGTQIGGIVAGTADGAFDLTVTKLRIYRSDLGGMQTNDTSDPTYYPTTSSAYYAPAFDYDPVTLASKGVRIEPAATNLVTYSSEFGHTDWVKNDTTITSSSTISPDGNMMGSSLNETSTTADHIMYQNTGALSTRLTMSVFAKRGTSNFIQLSSLSTSSQFANFDLLNGIIGTVGGGMTPADYSITHVGNGWYKLTAFLATSGAGANSITLIPDATSGYRLSYLGDASKHVYLYGAQLETGTVATSYIPTGASTVTRTIDNLSMTTGLIPFIGYNQAQVSGKLTVTPLADGALRYVNFNDGTANEVIEIGQDASNNVILTVTDGGVVQATVDSGVNAVIGTELVIGYRAGANNFAISVNGSTSVVDTSGTMPTVTGHQIGEHCHVKLEVEYDALLTDAQLVELST